MRNSNVWQPLPSIELIKKIKIILIYVSCTKLFCLDVYVCHDCCVCAGMRDCCVCVCVCLYGAWMYVSFSTYVCGCDLQLKKINKFQVFIICFLPFQPFTSEENVYLCIWWSTVLTYQAWWDNKKLNQAIFVLLTRWSMEMLTLSEKGVQCS